jgi:predicted unusual protein kinase regulating ubiquinone biosynthesis (AarF/ABC1/UbiB family)
MESRGITNVFAPNPVRAASSTRVLTAEWVDGVPLDAAWRTDALAPEKAGNIQALTALCLNAYLTMMLDSGILYMYPHTYI